MRRLILGGLIALTMGGAALAHDFIVVSSTDPSVRTGQALDAGAHLAIAPGKSVTLIRTSGEVVTIQGGAQGATLPAMMTAQADAGRFDAIHALFQAPPSGRTFGARRGFCPGADALTTLDSILQADKTGCKRASREAFQVYLKKAGAPNADELYGAPAADAPSAAQPAATPPMH
jgi:hypothetical protein